MQKACDYGTYIHLCEHIYCMCEKPESIMILKLPVMLLSNAAKYLSIYAQL